MGQRPKRGRKAPGQTGVGCTARGPEGQPQGGPHPSRRQTGGRRCSRTGGSLTCTPPPPGREQHECSKNVTQTTPPVALDTGVCWCAPVVRGCPNPHLRRTKGGRQGGNQTSRKDRPRPQTTNTTRSQWTTTKMEPPNSAGPKVDGNKAVNSGPTRCARGGQRRSRTQQSHRAAPPT